MKVVKPQRIALLHRPYEHMGVFHLAVVAALYFPFRQPNYLLPEIAMWKLLAKELGKDATLDLCLPKTAAEALVIGDCHVPGGKPAGRAQVRLTIGGDRPLIDKRLEVFGHRIWQRGATGMKQGEPEPFTVMPVDWAHAFGGPEHPENPLGKGAAPLPAAKDGRVLHPLPNIEDPLRLIVAPGDRPPPAGFGQLDFTWPQRASKAGTYDDTWLKTRFPGFADDIDLSMFNAASPNQWSKQSFAGDEPFSVTGMHPEHPVVQGTLPGAAMRCLVDQRTANGLVAREVSMKPDTLWLFPKAERAVLVFRGVISVGTDDGTDIENLLIAAEPMAEPRSFDYYREVLTARLDPKQAALLALRDEQLMPPQPARTAPLPDDDGAEDWLYTPRGLMHKRLRIRLEREFAKGRAELAQAREKVLAERQKLAAMLDRPWPEDKRQELAEAMASIDGQLVEIDDGIAALVVPPEEPPATLEELPALKKKMIEEGRKAQDAAKVKLAQVEQQARESMAAADDQMAKTRARLAKVDTDEARAKLAELPSGPLDYDRMKTDAKLRAGGPPRPMAPPTMEQLRQAGDQFKGLSAKITLAVRDAAAADPASEAAASILAADAAAANGLPLDLTKLEQQLHDGDARLAGMYRKGAHMMLPAMAMSAEGSEQARARVLAAHSARQSLSGVDLTGADLSGLDLKGIDLGDALMEAADLAGSDLTGANLAGAVLVRCRLDGTRLGSAKLAGANLGFADFSNADLAGADLSGATLSNATLFNANFTGALMTKADLLGAKFAGANFTRVVAPQTNFLNVDLGMPAEPPSIDFEPEPGPDLDMRGAIFAGADLQKSNFINCIVEGIDFSGANLSSAVFVAAKGNGCCFAGATMVNVRMVMDCSFADCDFTEATLDKGHLHGVNLASAIFTGCSAKETNFSEAVLSRAKLQKVAARGARFAKADLTLAEMQGIDLMDGVLQKAILHGTRLDGANLLGADLLRIKIDDGTDFTRANMKRTLAGAVARK